MMTAVEDTWQVDSWGSTSNGQLGVGAIESENVNTPTNIVHLNGKSIRSIACGRNHTLFLLSDGTVYSCGMNDSGQLGRDNKRSRPSKYIAL